MDSYDTRLSGRLWEAANRHDHEGVTHANSGRHRHKELTHRETLMVPPITLRLATRTGGAERPGRWR